VAEERTRKGKKRAASPKWWKRLKIGLCITALIGCVSVATGVVLFNRECDEAAPEVDRLYDEISKMQMPASEIVSSDGTVLYRVSGDSREYVRLEDIPKNVRNAIIAAEDRRFYEHPGVDIYSMARILFTNVREGRAAQGGSTITMQLAKRLTSKGEKTFKRKWHDMALAVDVEKKFTKDQVLELYLNQVYFGANAYGVKAAAAAYFNKDLKDLTLSDAAILARCVRRPSDVNPQNNYKKAIDNRNYVLHNMYDYGMIDEDELSTAMKEQPKIQKHSQRESRSSSTPTSLTTCLISFIVRSPTSILRKADIESRRLWMTRCRLRRGGSCALCS